MKVTDKCYWQVNIATSSEIDILDLTFSLLSANTMKGIATVSSGDHAAIVDMAAVAVFLG